MGIVVDLIYLNIIVWLFIFIKKIYKVLIINELFLMYIKVF